MAEHGGARGDISCEVSAAGAQAEPLSWRTPPWETRGGEVGLVHSDKSPEQIYLHSLRDWWLGFDIGGSDTDPGLADLDVLLD